MTSCNYRILNDIYEAIDELDLSVKIDELDVDLDNIEQQLTIANKLKLLEMIGTDIMTEEEQNSAYNDIKDELFGSTTVQGDSQDTTQQEPEGN